MLLLTVTGCTREASDPDARLYVRQLQPLLAENALLSQRMLEAAGQVHDGRANASTASVAWEREIAPLAEHLHDQASRLDAPPTWSSRHERLVGVWGMRAKAYRDVTIAVRKGDRSLWRKAGASADQAKLDEEAWFDDANAALASEGIELDQYP